jgi:hypothetical protein
VAVAVLFVAACGGGDDDGGSGVPGTVAPTATADAGPTSFTAEQLLPDLSNIGLGRSEVQRTPFSELDEAGVLYGEPSSPTPAIKLIIYVLDDEAAAEGQFVLLREAFENMPVAALLDDPLSAGDPQGQPAANANVVVGPEIDGESVYFRTKAPDRTGQHVWTDVHRIDNVAVVVQVLAREKPIADERREATIAAIAEKLDGR